VQCQQVGHHVLCLIKAPNLDLGRMEQIITGDFAHPATLTAMRRGLKIPGRHGRC